MTDWTSSEILDGLIEGVTWESTWGVGIEAKGTIIVSTIPEVDWSNSLEWISWGETDSSEPLASSSESESTSGEKCWS